MRYGKLGKALLIVALSTMATLAQARGDRVKHVFVIILENHSAASVIGDVDNPYITSLAKRYASAAKYYGVTHPSEPNYVALTSGSNWFVNNDDPNNRFPHSNLVDQLEAAHKTWAGYMDALPDNKLADFWPDSKTPLYVSRHNPFVLFENVRNNKKRLAHIKPYTSLGVDLAHEKTTPNFALIIPDQCHNMHGGVNTSVPGHAETPCKYGTDNGKGGMKEKADNFVKDAVTQIMASKAWKHTKSVIFIIADEGDFNDKETQNGEWESVEGCCDSPIVPKAAPDIDPAWPGGMYAGGLAPAVVIVSRGGKRGGYVSNTPYNHYSLLATIETVWNLGYLGFASDREQVKPMTEFLSR